MRIDTATIERLASQARAIDPEDDQFILDHIEGETDALEIADRLIAREAELAAHIEGIRAHEAELKIRKARLAKGVDGCRDMLARLLDAAGVRKIERPLATVSLRAVPPSLIGDEVPSDPRFIRTKVEPDKAAIKDALKGGEDVPGWRLSNGGSSVAVRRS